jgi:aspartate carbamoyltransferase catalytic subunit
MHRLSRNFLSIKDLDKTQIQFLFEKTKELKSAIHRKITLENIIDVSKATQTTIHLVFLEASTRTRLSFATAANRLGVKYCEFIGDANSSIAKGESLSDTIETVCAMDPDLVVLRFSGTENLWPLITNKNIPAVNAGDGISAHPTQAMLDAYTIQEKLKKINGLRILYVGDVKHSRVAQSGCEIFATLGAEVASCGPEAFRPHNSDWSNKKHFSDIKEALAWCDVVIGLRIQSERHDQKNSSIDYSKFMLTPQNLKALKADGLIMHPGPFVPSKDLDPEVLNDSRCAIRMQVRNGVYIRMAVLAASLELFR